MTSTTSSKSGFQNIKSILLWTLRNNVPVMVVYLSILAFFTVTNIAGSLGTNTVISGMGDRETTRQFSTLFNEIFVTSQISNAVLLGTIFALVTALRSTSYLHKKRETDMIGSLPVPRRTMFFSRLAASYILGAAPMLVMLVILNIFAPHSETNNWLNTVNALVSLLANVSFLGLLAVCCGKSSDKVLSFLGINAAFPVAILLLQLLPTSFLVGYKYHFNLILTLALTPLFSYSTENILYWLIFSAVCLVLSWALIKRRKAECAQSEFAFKLPLVAVKLIVSFASGIAMAYLFLVVDAMNTSGEYLRFWMGMIIGSLLVFVVAQLIFARGFRGFLKSLISYGVMIVCFAALFTSLACGFFGYNSRAVRAEDVKSVRLTDGYNREYNGKMLANKEITDKAVIQKVIDAENKMIDKELENRSMVLRSGVNILSMFDSFDSYNVVYPQEEGITFTYTLDSGRTLSREFKSTESKEGIDFFTSQDFYENFMPLYTCDSKDCTEMEVNGENFDFTEIKSADDRARLIEALRSDISKYGYDEDDEYEDSVTLAFGDKFNYSLELRPKGVRIGETIEISSKYKNTYKLLKELEKY